MSMLDDVWNDTMYAYQNGELSREQVALKFAEALKPSHNSAMLKCRLWNKGRGCPIGKVPCPEGHGCMLQIGTSA